MAFWLLRKWLDRGGLLAKPPVSEREYTSRMKASKTLFNYPQPGMIVSGAEWGLVPGPHLTEARQRDLEAVVAASPWSAHRILTLLGIPEASYYRRKKRTVWHHGGGRRPLAVQNVEAILGTARAHTAYGYRQVHAALQGEHPDVRVAPMTVYRVLHRHGL